MSDQPGWLVLMLVGAIAALATAVAFMFRTYYKSVASATKERREHDKALADKDAQFAKEREAWILERAGWDHSRNLERQKETTEFEVRHRQLIEKYDDDRAHERQQSQAYVDQVRKECADQIELLAQKNQEASDRTALVLDKIYDRFLSGPRRRNF